MKIVLFISSLIFAVVYLADSSSAATVKGNKDKLCKGEGFFRHPDNCKKFIRCFDFYGNGGLKAFHFVCPAGTVFDESVSVCNHPWAAPPCDEDEKKEEDTDDVVETTSSTTKKPGDFVVVSPSFGYECQGDGTFAHETDCSKFWLCKPERENGAELYKCPPKYLYHEELRRCRKEKEVECDKIPDPTRNALEPPAITISESQIDAFFRRWNS